MMTHLSGKYLLYLYHGAAALTAELGVFPGKKKKIVDVNKIVSFDKNARNRQLKCGTDDKL